MLTFPESLGLCGLRGPHSQQSNISSKDHSMYRTKPKATLPPRHFRIFRPRDQQASRGRDDYPLSSGRGTVVGTHEEQKGTWHWVVDLGTPCPVLIDTCYNLASEKHGNSGLRSLRDEDRSHVSRSATEDNGMMAKGEHIWNDGRGRGQ